MKHTARLVIILLGGFAIGAGAIGAVKAQGKKARLRDRRSRGDRPSKLPAIPGTVPATLKPYHGKVVVRGKADTKEGAAPNGNLVVLAFDNLDDAEGWYSSAAYRQIIPLRQRSAKTRLFIVEGLPQ
jgi:uncharacterized protein (DUF1330 family)